MDNIVIVLYWKYSKPINGRTYYEYFEIDFSNKACYNGMTEDLPAALNCVAVKSRKVAENLKMKLYEQGYKCEIRWGTTVPTML